MGCCQRGGENKCTLQKRVYVASIVDMVLAIIGIVVGSTDLKTLNKIRLDESKSEDERDDAIQTMYFESTVLLINVIKLVMGYVLWKGATTRNIKRCKIWLIVSIILWLIHLTDFIVKLTIGINEVISIVSTSLQIVGRIFAMVVVTLFIMQIKKEDAGGFRLSRPPGMV